MQRGTHEELSTRQTIDIVERVCYTHSEDNGYSSGSNSSLCIRFPELDKSSAESIGELYFTLASHLAASGQYEEAGRMFENAVKAQEYVFGVNNLRIVPTINNLGVTYLKIHQFGDALHSFNALCISCRPQRE